LINRNQGSAPEANAISDATPIRASIDTYLIKISKIHHLVNPKFIFRGRILEMAANPPLPFAIIGL